MHGCTDTRNGARLGEVWGFVEGGETWGHGDGGSGVLVIV